MRAGGNIGSLWRLWSAWGVVLARTALAATLWQEPVDLTHEWDTGPNHALFVAGEAEEMGSWNPAHAVRLTWTAGNIWTGRVALPAGQVHEYKFIRRSMDAALYCDSDNGDWMSGDNLAVTTPPLPSAPYADKTVFYHSAWSNVQILYRCGSTQWLGAAMADIGPGRAENERRHSIAGIGIPDETIEFVFNGLSNGVVQWDNAPVEGIGSGDWNYHTPLDVFWVQDKQLFNYPPPASPGAPRIEERFVNSTVAGIPGRTVRIWLPRGYDQNTTRRYPVLYMHDGQEVFCGGTPCSDQWNADWHAVREVGQGRMRECIIAAMDNGTNRQAEYEPPGDTYYAGYPSGVGDKYLQFFAANVRPTLDFNYRTLTAPGDTLIGGSSMGGLISIYFGYETNLFGGVLAMSPAITRAPNYTSALWGKNRKALRLYVDTGSSEGSIGPGGGDYWLKPWEAYAIFLRQGYAVNRDLLMRIGCGAGHNEAAWSARFPEAARFLLDVRREANALAQAAHPPRLEWLDAAQGWRSSTLGGYRYDLENSVALVATDPWLTYQASPTETNLWGSRDWTGNLPAGFYRLRALPAP